MNALNISIVLFNPEFNDVITLVENLYESEIVNKIYIIDNSPSPNAEISKINAIYIHNVVNIGYGSAHNIAINHSISSGVKYHLVLNLDVHVNVRVLKYFHEKLESNLSIGLIMPKVLNIDGSIQLLPKILPTPLNVIVRSLKPFHFFLKSVNRRYTLEGYMNQSMNVPVISGCFSFFRIDALREVGLYDESFFMYFEDFDLSRRIHRFYQTIYDPSATIIHKHERGAKKEIRLFIIFIKSAIKYFNKYGWFFDRERKILNFNVFTEL